MDKTKKPAVFSLLLSLALIVGSMACMDGIWRIRERRLLTESGSAEADSPVRAWRKEKSGKTDTEGNASLSREQIAEAIRHFDRRKEEFLHNPVEGQISMEEAIGIGERWIAEMGLKGGDGDREEAALYRAEATLSAGITEEDSGELEPYHSFWRVCFLNQRGNGVLYLNAVTGGVWSAEITVYEELPEGISAEKLRGFARLAGIEMENADFSQKVGERETLAVLRPKDGILYAKGEYYRLGAGRERSDEAEAVSEYVLTDGDKIRVTSAHGMGRIRYRIAPTEERIYNYDTDLTKVVQDVRVG